MKPLDIAREALRLVWRHKKLWPFGVFVAGAAGGGGAPGGAGSVGGIPVWALALAGVAGVLGIAALWMHVVSEGALIDGASRARRGEPVLAGDELRAGRARFGAVLRVKLLALATIVVVAAALATPAVLAWLHVLPAGAAVAAGATVAFVAAPWLLTAYFVYAYALRFAVLDGASAREAIRSAWRFLHGRVLESVKLLVMAFLGHVGGGIAAGIGIAPGAIVGALLYLATGRSILAVVVGALLAGPPALIVAGAVGAYRSAVWTLGFLESRAAGGS